MTTSWLCALGLWLASGGADIAEEISRLEGHEVEIAADGQSYRIVDVAGEGAPLVGIVERRGEALVVDGLVLEGPLAVPRIAGPGYKVWVVGERRGDRIEVRRIGVLRGPR